MPSHLSTDGLIHVSEIHVHRVSRMRKYIYGSSVLQLAGLRVFEAVVQVDNCLDASEIS